MPAAEGDMDKVTRLGFAFLGLTLFAGVAYYIELANTGWIGHRVLFTLRTQMFNHLQKLSLRFYDRNEVGRVMSRITSDVTTLQELLTSGLLAILADFVAVFIVVAIMLSQDVELTFITFAVVPFLVGCAGHLAGVREALVHSGASGDCDCQRQSAGERLGRPSNPGSLARTREQQAVRGRQPRQPFGERRCRPCDGPGHASC